MMHCFKADASCGRLAGGTNGVNISLGRTVLQEHKSCYNSSTSQAQGFGAMPDPLRMRARDVLSALQSGVMSSYV